MKQKGVTTIVIVIIVIIIVIAVTTGTYILTRGEEGGGGGAGGGEGGGEGTTGTATYTGTWSGTWFGSSKSGTFELNVNFDAGTVSGTMDSGYPGTVSGTISELAMSAEGTVATYYVTWTGDVFSDGSSISGNWQLSPPYSEYASGTWNGTRST